jgi:hypothetical protein
VILCDHVPQIFVSLGEKCNSELLDYYGFVLDDNANDCVHLDVEISKNDPLFTHKQSMYMAISPEYFIPFFFLVIHGYFSPAKLKVLTTGVTAELWTVAKAVTVSEEELTDDLLLGEIPEEPVSTRSELAISQYLLNACKKLYTGYPTNIQVIIFFLFFFEMKLIPFCSKMKNC